MPRLTPGFLTALAVAITPLAAVAADRPNIVVIYADDKY